MTLQMKKQNLGSYNADQVSYLLEIDREEAQRLIACYHGCVGLNPAAYRECVEALRLWVRAEDTLDKRLEWEAWSAALDALAHATGGQA